MKQIFDFSGKHIDRSEFQLSFDGSRLAIEMEDQRYDDRLLRIVFSWVSHFEFESVAATIEAPELAYEKLVQENAEDFLEPRKSLFGVFLGEETVRYRLFLNDVGSLIVLAKSVEIHRQE